MKLTRETKQVFASDGYNGVVMIELDWVQGVTYECGELNDGFDSIQDYFYNRTEKWYESVQDWFYEQDEFTSIESE